MSAKSCRFKAIIMAGGKGSRLARLGEKPLVQLGNKEMLVRVIEALKDSQYIDDIIVACSPYTPKTALKARSLGMKVIQTPGSGYVEDMNYIIQRLGTGRMVFVNSDLPFITGRLVDKVIEFFLHADKPSVAVMYRTNSMRQLGFEPLYEFSGLSPAGINVIQRNDSFEEQLEQETLILTDVLNLININTEEEVRMAEEMVKRGAAYK